MFFFCESKVIIVTCISSVFFTVTPCLSNSFAFNRLFFSRLNVCHIFGVLIAIKYPTIMKTLSTLLLLLSVSFALAQNSPVAKSNDTILVINKEKTNSDIAISTKGVKKLEDIKIETINKTTYLELMLSTKKNKDIKIC